MRNRVANLNPLYLLSALFLSPGLTACDDDDHDHDDHNHGEEAVDEHACIHAEEEGTSLTATLEAEAAPAASEDHTRYDVTLVELDAESGDLGGYISLPVGEDGDQVVFLTADIPLGIEDSEGLSLPAESDGDGSGTCSITRYYVFDLQVGTYGLFFGPTDVTELGMIVEEYDDHDHDDHDDHAH